MLHFLTGPMYRMVSGADGPRDTDEAASSAPGGLSRFRLWARTESGGVQAERLPDLMTDRDVP